MGTVNSGLYEHRHNGQEIKVIWQLQKDDYDFKKPQYTERIQFEYEGAEVIVFYEREGFKRWDTVTQFYCNVIDRIGGENYLCFKDYHDRFTQLQEKYIIINDKLYNPTVYRHSMSQNLNFYKVNMEMEDGNIIDGKVDRDEQGIETQYKQDYNKDELISNLKLKIKAYNEKKGILPHKKHIDNEKSNEYNEILGWFEEKGVLGFIKLDN